MFDLTPDEWIAIRLSLRIAIVATVVALPFGIAVAWLLARKDFWGKSLLDGIVHLPLVLPPVVTGYLLLISFGRRGPIGAFLADNFGIVFSFRWTGAALACGVMAFPLLVRAIRLSFEAIDRRLEDAAAHARRQPASRTFLTVTLPLALPGIIAGMVLCFAKALGEFGATITFVSNIPGETQTISAAIYTLTQVPGGDAAAFRLVVVADRHLAGRADRLGMVRAPRRHALPRGLTMLTVDIEKRLGDFAIAVAFESDGRRHRAVRPLGLRQDLDRQHDRRPDHAGPRPHRARRHRAVRLRRAHQRAGAPPPHRLRVPGRPAVPASVGRRQSRLRPPHVAAAARRGRAASASSTCSTSATCSTAGPASSPAASASASRSAARC